MKIAFFGTPPFTASFLNMLNDHGYTPSIIVTNPDRPSGRGMTLQSPLPKVWGQEHSISVLQPEKIDQDFIDSLGAWDLFVVVAYGKILPEPLINLPKYGTLNVHYSLLPKYRGATPVESAILNGDQTTGVVIQQMRYKLDTGPIVAQKEINVALDDTTLSLREKLNTEALVLLPEVLKNIENGRVELKEQSEDATSHCKKISKEDGEISLTDDPITLDRKWRAYQPWPGLYFFLPAQAGQDSKRIKITKAHFKNNQFIIDEVIPENGKKMPYDTFVSSLS
jgi:methionyl-tRNA formyltransferase